MIAAIVSVEDDSYQGKDFKKVKLDNGEIIKVKYGRDGKLKAKWSELVVGTVMDWAMGDYNGKPFVQDFTHYDGEYTPPSPAEVVKKSIENDKDAFEQFIKIRSMAFSYAKDLYIADKITDKQLFPTADKIAEWMYQVTITQ